MNVTCRHCSNVIDLSICIAWVQFSDAQLFPTNTSVIPTVSYITRKWHKSTVQITSLMGAPSSCLKRWRPVSPSRWDDRQTLWHNNSSSPLFTLITGEIIPNSWKDWALYGTKILDHGYINMQSTVCAMQTWQSKNCTITKWRCKCLIVLTDHTWQLLVQFWVQDTDLQLQDNIQSYFA